jgi:hypothetical protein
MKKKREEVIISEEVDDTGTTWRRVQGTSNRFLVFYGDFLTWLGSKMIGWGEPYATYYEMIIEDEDEK